MNVNSRLSGVEASRARRADNSPNFGDRILQTAHAVAAAGPLSLAELDVLLAIPRVSIWRALQTLVRVGWVRQVHGTNEYELTENASNPFTNAHVAYKEANEYGPFLSAIKGCKGMYAAVGLLLDHGDFRIAESTHVSYTADNAALLIDSDLGLAALIACLSHEIDQHLSQYAVSEQASREERLAIQNGDAAELLQMHANSGLIKSYDTLHFALPVRFSTGRSGSLEIGVWRDSRAARNTFDALLTNAERIVAGRAGKPKVPFDMKTVLTEVVREHRRVAG
ncbi:helix-turn-helix domain-containing protein [Celeribacter neptunius]|uniref:helix-turn-helix domain-containing protein n=1 Tax=Celeribacter neptunius TaxID=588602 RepID=UPI000B802650|nr:helix-turn-helix domain-containing protein [Celeribacter neptunius]